MKFVYIVLFFALNLFCFWAYSFVYAVWDLDSRIPQVAKWAYVEWELIVIYKDGSEILNWLNNIKTLSNSQVTNFNPDLIEVVKVESGVTLENAISEILLNPKVAYAQPNFIYNTREFLSPNDTFYSSLWAIKNTWQNVNWTSWTNDADLDWLEALDIYHWNLLSLSWVIVAVIDDWVAYDHPDLSSSMWESATCKDENWNSIWVCENWYDFWDNDKYPAPVTSHWTHVAWIIASEINNLKWNIWLAPHAKIMALKSRLTTNEIVRAIDFAKNNWAKIINASWWAWITAANCSSALDIATYLTISSFPWVFIAAAWNDDKNHDLSTYFDYPADYAFDTWCWWWLNNIIVVWASDQNDNKASFSDYWNVHISAPWTNIYSAQFSSTSVFTENFSSYNQTSLTWFLITWTWNWWVNNWSLYWDLTSPLLDNIETFITSTWIDLSGKRAATFNFTSYCDTEITYTWWDDYMSLLFQSWSIVSVKELWDEAWSSNNLFTSKATQWDFTKYIFSVEIPQNYLIKNFQYVFGWATDGDNNDFNWCYVDDISILSYDNWTGEAYAYKNWTSMATPYVSWLAAMIYAIKPTYSITQVIDLIIDSWDSVWNLASYFTSWKRINAYKTIWKIANPSINVISAYTDSWKLVSIQDSTWINTSWAYIEWQEPEHQWVMSWYTVSFFSSWSSSGNFSQSFTWFELSSAWISLEQWITTFSINWFNDMWATWAVAALFNLFVDNQIPWTWLVLSPINYYSSTWFISFNFLPATDILSSVDHYIINYYDESNLISSWSITWTWSFETWISIDWFYYWNIQAVDVAWNIWDFSNTWSFIIDKVAPEKPFVLLNSWSIIWSNNQTWVILFWILNQSESWSILEYTITDLQSNIVSWSASLSSSTWLEINWINVSNLSDWYLSLSAYIRDLAWNIWLAWTGQVIKETVPPSWSISINSWSTITNQTWVTVTFSASEYPVDYYLSWTGLVGIYTWTLTDSASGSVELSQWDGMKLITVYYTDLWSNSSETSVSSIVLDQTSVSWSISSDVLNTSWSSWINFTLLSSDSDFLSSNVFWSNNLNSSTWSWLNFTVSSWTTWNLIVSVNIIDNAWNEISLNSDSYLIDNQAPSISFTQSWNSSYFTWEFLDSDSWISTGTVKWYYSLWWSTLWVPITNWTITWAYIADELRYWWDVYVKLSIEDIVWNEQEYISSSIIIEWNNSFGSTVSLSLSNLSNSIKSLSLDQNQDTSWLIRSNSDTIDSVIDVLLTSSTWVTIPITVSWASILRPKIIEVYNPYTWLYELQSALSSDIQALINLSYDTKIIVRTIDALWATSLSWNISTAVTPSSSWALTTGWNSFSIIWSWSSVLFSSWVSISSGYTWIILPPTEFNFSSWSILDTASKPWTMISVGANWKSIYFTWWLVTLTMDLWEECTTSARVKYWDNLSWSWIDYTSSVSNILCNSNSLSFDVNHFSIYWWDWLACTLSQVTCSTTCWNWSYQKNSWEDCSWWYIWSSCNLGTCPVVQSTSWGWWWGWWWWVMSNLISTYVLPSVAKNDIKTFDNIDLKNIDSWILPVSIKISEVSGNYYTDLPAWTKITAEDWSIYNWVISAPVRVSNTKLPSMEKWASPLRALQIWSDDLNIFFSKPVKLSLSTKWLSKSIDRNNIQIYSYNYKTKVYSIETDRRSYDELAESISVNVDHFSLFVLAFSDKLISTASVIPYVNDSDLPFTDLDWHWSRSYVSNLYKMWVFKTNDKFYPEQSLNRAELVKIVVESFWYQKNENLGILTFNDIDKNGWYITYLAAAVENWIITWDQWSNTFRPWDSVNRAEAVKVILEAAKFDLALLEWVFHDVPSDAWFSIYVNYAAEKWIVSWYWNWLFWPWKDITRWQIAKIVSRVLVLKEI